LVLVKKPDKSYRVCDNFKELNKITVFDPEPMMSKSKSPNVEKWGDRQENAFKEVKRFLSNEPILKLPELNREFILQTDALNQSLGGCLLQEHDGIKHPIFYASRKLIQRELFSGEREALAIFWAVSKFHRFLHGQHFTLESDHRPLEYLQSSHPKNPRLMRRSLTLQPYRYTVRYIRGFHNIVADYLSPAYESLSHSEF